MRQSYFLCKLATDIKNEYNFCVIIFWRECMQSSFQISSLDANIIKSNMPNVAVCVSLAEFYSIFSDTTRLKILIALSLTEMCVNDLSCLLDINQTTVSHQLKTLKGIGAVKATRKNKYIFYKVTDRFINNIMINGVDFILNKKCV